MRTRFPRISAIFLFLLAGCVGTDYVNDPLTLKPARIEITPKVLALEVGKTATFQAAYYDSLGNRVSGVAFIWSSSDPATVAIDANGTATARKTGQARLTAHARNVVSEAALLTAVADPNQVATVEVTPSNGVLLVGNTLQFSALARNLSGAVLSGKTFIWRSSDAAVASVSTNGLVAALAPGETNITAEVEGVKSPDVLVSVVSTSRTGAFTKNPSTSYNVSGTATLEQQPSGAIVLKFAADFSSSNGPGLEVFLSKTNTAGANSVNLGRLQRTSGAQSYNVPSSVTLTSHDWVIIHCVPFNVTFGYAQLR
jgi:uncharacterized protein YjdB